MSLFTNYSKSTNKSHSPPEGWDVEDSETPNLLVIFDSIIEKISSLNSIVNISVDQKDVSLFYLLICFYCVHVHEASS